MVTRREERSVTLPGLDLPARKITAELAFGPSNRLHMPVAVWLPSGVTSAVPVILAIEPVWWEGPFLRHAIVQRLLSRGYGFAGFDHNALASYEDPSRCAAKDAYPGQDWGTVAVVAWGCSVTLDWLETEPGVHSRQVAVFGHSRRGKSAVLAGALDERFAAVLPHMSGMGGTASYRVRGKGAQRLPQLKEQEWLHPGVFGFVGREDDLPFDQHWLHALIAPRALYIHVGHRDAWGNPAGEVAAWEAARPVFQELGFPGRLGIGIVDREHTDPNGAEGSDSWEAVLDFLDLQFRGRNSGRNFTAPPDLP